MSENPVGVAMKIHSSALIRDLDYDIKLPEFYDGFAQYGGFEITQAQYFIDRAHYSDKD